MARKKPKAPDEAFSQAWEVAFTEVKPLRILLCPVCGRKTVYRMNPKAEKAPFCVKCLDKALLKLGLKRMTDKGPAPDPKKGLTMSWAPSASAVGKVIKGKSKRG